jgi:hypothetical protein
MSDKNGKGKLRGLKQVDAPWEMHTVMVTPEFALELLGNMDPNRSISQRKVNGFARDMLAGKWRLNAETMKLAEDGKLIDGEHRLWAVTEAKVAVPMTIAYGVPRDWRRTVDTGRSRSFSDIMKIEGATLGSGRTAAGVIRLIALYRIGRLAQPKTIFPTHEELESILAEPGIAATIEDFGNRYIRRVRHPSIIGFVYWRAMQDDQDKARDWAEGVATGLDMKADDPRYQLRERLNEPKAGHWPTLEVTALAIKSWNLFYTGKRVPNLRIRLTGAAPEGFPEFVTDTQPAHVATVARQVKRRARDTQKMREYRKRKVKA